MTLVKVTKLACKVSDLDLVEAQWIFFVIRDCEIQMVDSTTRPGGQEFS